MTALEKFLEKILIKDSTLTELNKADILDEDIDSLASRYLKSRDSHYEAKKLPEALKKRDEETIEKYNIKIRKNLKEFASLGTDWSNAKMDEYKGKSIDIFFDDAKEVFDAAQAEKVGGIKTDSNKDVEKWKDLATSRQKKVEEFEEQIVNIKAETKAEYEAKYVKERAKLKYRKWITKQQKENKIAAGNEYAYENIENKIFSDKYKVDDELNLFKADDTKAVHPEKEIALDTAKELAMYHIEKAQLNKENKARLVPKSFEKKVSEQTIVGDDPASKARAARIEAYKKQLEGTATGL
jgi:hypothetical protein